MTSALRWVAAVQALGAAVLVLGASVPGPCCGPDQWEAVSFLQNAKYMETGNRVCVTFSLYLILFICHPSSANAWRAVY